MKKIVSFSSLLLLFLASTAQIRTTIYQGRTVNIFPYRIQIDNYQGYESRNSLFENLSIPYCPEKLEDGEYVIYYKPEINLDDVKSVEKFAKGDTILIAANFSITNGLKDGPVCFYEFLDQKVPIASGYYTADVKIGLWTTNTKKIKAKTEFKAGVLDGDFEYLEKRTKLMYNGTFKDGKINGVCNGYKGKKLVYMMTFKNGLTYGPYFFSLGMFNEGDATGEVDSYKGFRIGDIDSITQIYDKKGKLISGLINSFTALKGMDTTEPEWFLSADKLGINKNETFMGNPDYFTRTVYTNCYQVGKKESRINNYFLINGEIKIPFVQLDELGDTILKVERWENTPKHKKIKLIRKGYDLKHQLNFISEAHITIIKGIDGLPNRWQKEELIRSESFSKKEITKIITLNRPLPGFKGFVIKKDSTCKILRKTMMPFETKETIKIEVLDFEIVNTSWISYKANIPDTFSYSYPDCTYQLLGNDTLEVKSKDYISEHLSSTFTRKVCLSDSSEIYLGSANIINVRDACSIWDDNSNSFIGKDGNTLYYKNKPYTGGLSIERKKSKKVKRYESKIDHEVKYGNLYLTQWVHTDRMRLHLLSRLFRKFRKVSNEYETTVARGINNNENVEYTFNYKNGKLHGYQSAEDDYSQKQYVLNFNNGINHGPQIYSMNNYENQFDSYNGSKAHINYDSGRIDGYVILLKNYSMPRLVTIYNKGKINGIYTTFNTDELVPKPSLEAHFTNDTLQGDVVIYSLGFEKSRTPFINGDATGIYTSNHVQLINEELSDSVHFNKSYIKFYPELKLKLKNGELRDTAFAYFENGAIKYIAIADTLIHHKLIYQDEKSIRKEPYRQIMDSAAAAPAAYTDLILKGDYDEEEIATEVTEVYRGNQIYFGLGEQYGANEMEIDPVFDMPKAHFTFYYKSGLKSQEGRMSSNEKYGVWKYWNENGVLMKEIEYKAGVDSSTMQTVWYRGKITGYYPSGKKMMEGLILDEELSYQCSQEVEIAYEDVYYLNFLSETGDSLLKKQTGPVTDYHLNGHKHFMGQVTYGNRTGLWRFYDPDGNLKAIGEYADGYKQGKWLEGDLGGINFLDNACSINEALSLIQEKRLHDIDVTETIYEMGREVSSSHLVLEKF